MLNMDMFSNAIPTVVTGLFGSIYGYYVAANIDADIIQGALIGGIFGASFDAKTMKRTYN